jgi:hypothetical protein
MGDENNQGGADGYGDDLFALADFHWVSRSGVWAVEVVQSHAVFSPSASKFSSRCAVCIFAPIPGAADAARRRRTLLHMLADCAMSGKLWQARLLAGLLLAVAPACLAQGWYGSWSAAVDASKKSGKPLIAVFEQDGCPECQRMESALQSGKARSALRNAVKVRLEYNDARGLAERFGVRATPTLMLFAPDSGFGDCLFREEGAMSVSALVRLGRNVDGLASRAPKQAPAPSQENAKPEQPAQSGAKATGPAEKGKQAVDAGTVATAPAPQVRPRSGKTRVPARVSHIALPSSPYEPVPCPETTDQAAGGPPAQPGRRVYTFYY